MYFPILKGCLGEWIALENVPASVRSSVFPTIEIPPVESTFEEELGVVTGQKKSVAEHVRHFSKAMTKHLPQHWEFGLDAKRCFRDDKAHANMYQDLVASAWASRHLAVPVTGLGRSNTYQHAIQELLQTNGGKLVLRLSDQELLSPTATQRRIDMFAQTFGWRFDRLTVLIDLEQQMRLSLGPIPIAYESFAEVGANINDFAEVAIVMTSMNDRVTKELKPFQTADVAREDLAIWNQVRAIDSGVRLPQFGDYGVNSPMYAAVDFRMMTLCGKVRYSLNDRWVIFRGKKIEKDDNQFHRLAQMVTEHSEYFGTDTSWGDRQISDCATLRIGPGTLRNWVSYTLNHHLTNMPRLLANAA
ncbi:beta family protein [Novipirellula rosea]|uniref:Beta family protein n=1 Tax=Novipirellula rosea TaxID=1031540 RepID=A0ABP8MCG9_9BACT